MGFNGFTKASDCFNNKSNCDKPFIGVLCLIEAGFWSANGVFAIINMITAQGYKAKETPTTQKKGMSESIRSQRN